MVWKIYPWNKLASVKFHTITAVREGRGEHISLHLLYCAVQLFVRISSGSSAGYLLASRALSELQQAGALHGSQGRVCGLAPPWSCRVLGTGCAILPRCFCGQGRQLGCTVHEGYICCAVLVCLCKPPGGWMLGKIGSNPGDGIKADQREKQQHCLTLPSLKYNFVPFSE